MDTASFLPLSTESVHKKAPIVRMAGKQQKKPWIETPLVESSVLSRAAGCRVFLKLENLQPGGSFKSRAMGSLILHHINDPANANRDLHFYINSGGNAGLAAVCAARSLDYPCSVVLPMTASRLMVDKLHAAGATQVIQHGDTIAEAGVYMKNAVMKENTPGSGEDVVKIALHPFDHEAIWQGNSSIVDELAYQLPPGNDEESALPVDALVCSVGGGGLMNGLIQGIERRRRRQAQKEDVKDIHILAVETDGTQSMALAMSQKALVTLPAVTSMAVSLACVRVSEKTFEYCITPPPGIAIHSAVLSDADAARGCLRLADDERMLVELACGVCVEATIGDRFKQQQQLKDQSKSSKRKRAPLSDEGYYGDEHDNISKPGRFDGSSTSLIDSAFGSDEEDDATVSPQLSHLKQLIPNLTPESRVVIVVCGGSNVTYGMVSEWRDKLDNGWL